MQAFIKDKNELVINSMILDNEKEELLDYIERATKTGITVGALYDVDGNISGVKFKVN